MEKAKNAMQIDEKKAQGCNKADVVVKNQR
jgi:hypothetical protein